MQPNENPLTTPSSDPIPPNPTPAPAPAPLEQAQYQPEKIAQQAFQPSTPDSIQSQQVSPGMVQPVAVPVQSPAQQSTDPSQIGYVPPVSTGPVNLNMPEFNSNNGKKPSKLSLGLKIVLGIFVGLIFSAGAFTILKDTLFSGSKIEVSDLSEESVDGLNFSRPKDWVEVDEPDYLAAYTEGGKVLDDADQAVIVLSENIGGNFDDLSQEQKDEFERSLKDSFSDTNNLTDGGSCEEVSSSSVEKTDHKNYPLAFKIEVVCSKFTGRNVAGELRGVIAIKDTKLDYVIVVAIDKTWNKSGEALEFILQNFSRSN